MTIYIGSIILLFLMSYLEVMYPLTRQLKICMYVTAYLLLVLQVGLRWETGTDWNGYLEPFGKIDDLSSTSPLVTTMEFGYNLFVWIVKLFSNQYTVFLLVHAIIYYALLFVSVKKYAPLFFLSMLLIYTGTMGIMGSNRQLIAIVICLYALRYVAEKKLYKFLLLIFIAVNFHTTALLFLVYYFLNKDIRPVLLITLIGVALIIGKTQLPLASFSFVATAIGGNSAGKALEYLDSAKDLLVDQKLSVFGIVKRLVFIFIFYYNRKKLSETIPYYTLMLNGYIVGIVFYFLFSETLIIMVNRGSLYFNIFEPILLACQFNLLSKTENRKALLAFFFIFSFFYFFQSIVNYADLFIPYKGTFINQDYHRFIY